MPTFNAYLPAGRFTSEQKRALADAFHRALMESFGTPPGDRFIVRGLSSYHGLDTAVSEDRVLIRPGGYSIPESIDVALIREHREQDILRYAFCPIQDGDLSSFWHLIFFDRTDFFAVITRADGSRIRHLSVIWILAKRRLLAPQSFLEAQRYDK